MTDLQWIDGAIVQMTGDDNVTTGANGMIKGARVAFDGAWLHVDLEKSNPPHPGRGIRVYSITHVYHVQYEERPETAEAPAIALHEDQPEQSVFGGSAGDLFAEDRERLLGGGGHFGGSPD